MLIKGRADNKQFHHESCTVWTGSTHSQLVSSSIVESKIIQIHFQLSLIITLWVRKITQGEAELGSKVLRATNSNYSKSELGDSAASGGVG